MNYHRVTMINDLPELDDLESRPNYIRNTHRPVPQSGMREEVKEVETYVQPTYVINCIEIARHIEGCPICSRFYNNDKTMYIIVIVILAIVCLLLMKRVLNV
jgi:hypothetical protein